MSGSNKLKIINLVRLQQPISKVEISEILDLSFTAVTKYVNELLDEKVMVQTSSAESSGGRRSRLYGINKDYGYVAAVDFGQGTTKICIADSNNEIIEMTTFESSILGKKETGIPILIAKIRELMEKAGSVRLIGLGLSISGIIDHTNGVCYLIPNIPGWENVNFREIFESEFSVPVSVDDSARTAALSQSIHPKGRDRNLIYISLGIGIGMGIIMDWNLFRGKSGAAGEIGHIIVKPDGIQCGCGNKGCLEQYSSVPAMARRISDSIKAGVTSSITDLVSNDLDKIDGYIIQKALESHDKLTYNIVNEAGYYLGYCLSQIVTLFNPNKIIIGGGGINISDDIVRESKKTIQRFAMNRSAQDVQILQPPPNSHCALTGMSLMVLDHHFNLDDVSKGEAYLESLFRISSK